MTNFQKRRRVLQLAGTGVAASIAGCSDLSVSDEAGETDADSQLTAVAEPSAEEIEELEAELQAGELDQQEAQQRQMELFENAVEDFEDRVAAEDDDDLSIEETEDDVAVYRVDGSADVLVDALRTGDVSILGESGLYDQLLQQQQPAQGGEPEGEEIDEEELEEELQEQIDEQEGEDGEGGEDGDGDGDHADSDEESDDEDASDE